MIETRIFPFSQGEIVMFSVPVEDTCEGRAAREGRAKELLLNHRFGREAALHHYPSGAPYIIVGSSAVSSVSLSHDRRRVVMALAPEGVKIGVDTETFRPQLLRVAPRVLSEAELEAYGPGLEGLALAWCLKEAAYKAAGTPGLDFRRDICLPLNEGEDIITLPGGTLKIVHTNIDGGGAMAIVAG